VVAVIHHCVGRDLGIAEAASLRVARDHHVPSHLGAVEAAAAPAPRPTGQQALETESRSSPRHTGAEGREPVEQARLRT